MTLCREFHPVRLVKFRPNHVVQVRNLIIFADQGRWQLWVLVSFRAGLDFGEVSLKYLPVRPNFECALIVVTTRRNIAAGTTCTSSRRMNPHSREVRNSIIFFDSWERLWVFATME